MIRTPVIRVDSDENHLTYVNKSDALWTNVRNRVENGLRVAQCLKNKFSKNIRSNFEGDQIYDRIVTRSQYDVMFSEKEKLECLSADLKYIVSCFGNAESDQCNILCQGAVTLATTLEELLAGINSYKSNVVVNSDTEDVESKVEGLRKKMLIGIQKVYQKYCTVAEEQTEETDELGLKKNHLKELVFESLKTDIELLDVKKVCIRTSVAVEALILQPCYDIATRKRYFELYCGLIDIMCQGSYIGSYDT